MPQAEIRGKTDSFPPTDNVEILLDRPTRQHKTFAILEDTLGGTREEINGRLASKAQEIGADAIVIVSINDKTVTDWLINDPNFNARGMPSALSPRKTQLTQCACPVDQIHQVTGKA